MKIKDFYLPRKAEHKQPKNKTKARPKRRKSLQQVDNGIREGMP